MEAMRRGNVRGTGWHETTLDTGERELFENEVLSTTEASSYR